MATTTDAGVWREGLPVEEEGELGSEENGKTASKN
jgi:hypothetical protein